MSNISKRRREGSRTKIKSMGDHKEFLKRITKTLYYGQLPTLACLSLPVTEISCSLWSETQRGRSLRRLHADAAASIARSACVSPCALVLAILYLERLNACNPDYLANAAPAELFLVSLMVGNKFLQDDGEDDDVICSEWAASGGLELDQLKKLEVEFLNAIEWKVFVSDKSFEAGLLWLERQVALRQAQLRGFFTYGDLAASCDAALLHDLLHSVATACSALVLAYVSGLATVLTSTLMISHAWLPLLQFVALRGSVDSLAPFAPLPTHDTNIITHSLQPDLTPYTNNATLDTPEDPLEEETSTPDGLKCCTKWTRYRDITSTKRNWHDAIVVYDWKSFEPWWSKTSVLNWLYQSSLVDPMQRWLDKINEYADVFTREFVSESAGAEPCDALGAQRCVRQWLNLSKLGALVASVADR
ncbi:protein CNPPD1 [Anticarsia gemmatalis]|uniref:protein CNPPD1 n=1 Tax=Anticarsia gemmatalis TaxID=129554 RepID=UPI003F767A6F